MTLTTAYTQKGVGFAGNSGETERTAKRKGQPVRWYQSSAGAVPRAARQAHDLKEQQGLCKGLTLRV